MLCWGRRGGRQAATGGRRGKFLEYKSNQRQSESSMCQLIISTACQMGLAAAAQEEEKVMSFGSRRPNSYSTEIPDAEKVPQYVHGIQSEITTLGRPSPSPLLQRVFVHLGRGAVGGAEIKSPFVCLMNCPLAVLSFCFRLFFLPLHKCEPPIRITSHYVSGKEVVGERAVRYRESNFTLISN